MARRQVWARSRRWLVIVAVSAPLIGCDGLPVPGRVSVGNTEVSTGVQVPAGSTVRLEASGTVDFGGAVLGIGAPKLTADGDDAPTPADYPAPQLRKNSLIAKVGTRWYQGGTDKTFVPTEDGELVLRPNDSDLTDNSRGWQVRVTVTPAAPTGAGPYEFVVSNVVIATRVQILAGSSVQMQSSGTVDFGGAVLGIGAPKLTADGDDAATPADYPAPQLRKNSLIAKVGTRWYQGGTDKTFVPTEDGELVLRPNDSDLTDNSRGWQVRVSVKPPAAVAVARTYGPLMISNIEVPTAAQVRAGSKVRLSASGIVDFGGAVFGIGAPKLTADGDDAPTPADYPAPQLRKNSLIAKVGTQWYQGGTDKTFVPTEDGEIILRPNDNDLANNSRGWEVSITVTPP